VERSPCPTWLDETFRSVEGAAVLAAVAFIRCRGKYDLSALVPDLAQQASDSFLDLMQAPLSLPNFDWSVRSTAATSLQRCLL
jgi:hypothetical protein